MAWLTPQKRATVVHRVVVRSRAGSLVTGDLIELLALLKETGKLRPGLVADLPRTNNDLEQLFGLTAARSGASPAAKPLRG